MKSIRVLTYFYITVITLGTAPMLSVEGALPEGLAETLELRIDTDLKKSLQELVTEKQVCEELWLTWPVEQPEKDIGEVEKDIQKLIKIKTEAQFPASIQEDYEKEAVAKYILFEIGQLVEFKLKDGTTVNGYLRDLRQTEVLIDNRAIELLAIDEDDFAHFDETTREIRIREYIRAKLATLREERVNYERKIKEEVSRQLFLDSGYIQIDGKSVGKKDYVSSRLATRRKKLGERLKPLLRTKIYYDRGFVLYENEWLTTEEADRREKEKLAKEQALLEASENRNLDNINEEGEEDDETSLWD